MDTTLSDVELAVQQSFGRFFATQSTSDVVREAEPFGFDAELWSRLLDLGALSMAVPTSAGGDDSGLLCLALVAEQLGRTVAPVPLIDCVAAVRAIARSDDPEARALVTAILDGEETVVLSPRSIVGGIAPLTPQGAIADRVLALEDNRLVVARVVPGTQAPRNLGSMPLANCAVVGERIVLAEGDAAISGFAVALAEAKTLLAAALVGIADRSMEMALEYVKVRRAFGTLVGSFQTVSHRLADDAVDLDGARLLAYEAAWAHDEGIDTAASVASMALIFATETAQQCSGDCLHFHGGVGFTMEHDLQLFWRRAKAWPLAYSSLEDEYQQLADLLYGPREQVA